MLPIEAIVQRCSVKKLFLNISQNSQENTCDRVFFLKSCRPWPVTILKKWIWHRCFPVSSEKIFKNTFL